MPPQTPTHILTESNSWLWCLLIGLPFAAQFAETMPSMTPSTNLSSSVLPVLADADTPTAELAQELSASATTAPVAAPKPADEPSTTMQANAKAKPELWAFLSEERLSVIEATGSCPLLNPGEIYIDRVAAFRPGQRVLDGSSTRQIRRLAMALRQCPGLIELDLIGFADATPIRHSGAQSNQHLSRTRAEAVAAVFREAPLRLGSVNAGAADADDTGFGENSERYPRRVAVRLRHILD